MDCRCGLLVCLILRRLGFQCVDVGDLSQFQKKKKNKKKKTKNKTFFIAESIKKRRDSPPMSFSWLVNAVFGENPDTDSSDSEDNPAAGGSGVGMALSFSECVVLFFSFLLAITGRL